MKDDPDFKRIKRLIDDERFIVLIRDGKGWKLAEPGDSQCPPLYKWEQVESIAAQNGIGNIVIAKLVAHSLSRFSMQRLVAGQWIVWPPKDGDPIPNTLAEHI